MDVFLEAVKLYKSRRTLNLERIYPERGFDAMDDYYQQSIEDLQLAGMNESTQECYTRSERKRVDFYGIPPEKITEQQIQHYFLHRCNVDKWTSATLRIACGIKSFFTNLLKRDWHTSAISMPNGKNVDLRWPLLFPICPTLASKSGLLTLYYRWFLKIQPNFSILVWSDPDEVVRPG